MVFVQDNFGHLIPAKNEMQAKEIIDLISISIDCSTKKCTNIDTNPFVKCFMKRVMPNGYNGLR